LLAWIVAWLTDRQQRVLLNGKESTWEEVLSGVPQGSVLGPLLFIIFINDLDLSVSEMELLYKFADDTKVARVIDSESDSVELQRALDKLFDWSVKWGMQFNVAKCKVMHLGT
jgi:ribonucleases P/MRP protein subunit RPP40